MKEQALKIKLKVDADTGELTLTRKEMSKLGKGVSDTEKSFNKSFNSMKNSVLGLAAAYVSIQTVMKGVDVAVDFTKTAMEFEKFDTVLETIEGSSEKASASMGWITEFTKKTPYELTDVTDSFVKLRAYGIDPTDGTMKTLGDTASAMGKSLDSAVEAMADAVTGENERLKEFGIKASKTGNEITYNWTSASGEAKSKIVENNAQVIESTLEAIFNSKYEGAMEAQSKTLEGMISNINDSYTIFQKNVMDAGLYDYTKALTKVLGEDLSIALSMTSGNVSSFTKFAISAINSIINGVGFLKDAFNGVKLVVKSIELGFLYMVKGITIGINGVISTLNFYIDAYNGLPEWMRGGNIAPITKMGSEIDESISSAKKEWQDLVASMSEGRDYAKEFTDKVNIAFKSVKSGGSGGSGGKGGLSKLSNKTQLKSSETDMASLDSMSNILDMQIDLISSTKDWQNGLEGVAGSIGGVSTAFSKMSVDNLNFTKAQITLDEKYRKDKEKYSKDSFKLGKLEKKYNEDTAKIKNISRNNELDGYSQLAGAASGFFKESSDGYKLLQGAQIALQFAIQGTALADSMAAASAVASSSAVIAAKSAEAGANATAAVTAAGSGDPYTAPARVLAMIALMASAITMFGGSSGGGGSSASSVPKLSESELSIGNNDLIIDRLDRQIELLEVIGLKGAVSRTSVSSASSTFDSDKLRLEKLDGSGIYSFDKLQSIYSDNPVGGSELGLYDFTDTLNNGVLEYISSLSEMLVTDYSYLSEIGADWLIPTEESLLAVGEMVGAAQEAINTFALSMFDVISTMEDASSSFKDMYDDLTGTQTYKNAELAKATQEVNDLIDGSNLSDYLASQITAIDKVSESFGITIQELLLSTDPKDLQDQADAVRVLADETNQAFDNGVESALNYLDSIELVAEEMIRKEEELQEARLSLLDGALSTVSSDISTIESSMSSISSVSKNLKDAANGSGYGLDQFYKSMTESLSLAGGTDYEGFSESLQNTIGYSSQLSNASNFETSRDMQFAQLVAANQFDNMGETLDTELNVLQQIKEGLESQLDELNGTVKDLTDITMQQANEIVKLRKEVEDQAS